MTNEVTTTSGRNLADWLAYIEQVHPAGIDMGLERIAKVARSLSLHETAAHVITVAGTNGKGSTAVAMEQLLLRAGKSVGCTLSPHIARFEERIRIAGVPTRAQHICKAFAAVEAHRGTTPLTYFEFAALAALWCFRDSGAEVILLEIGLGGRLDAFNLLSADTAIITSIGLDHQSYLGADLNSIGAEKAGILRRGQRVCLGPDMPASVFARCSELALEPLQVGAQLQLQIRAGQWSLSCTQPDHSWQTPLLPANPFVLSNCALALAAVWPLIERSPASGARVLANWSAQLQLPGRCQSLAAQGRQWLLDVAHNPLAAAHLLAHLRGREPERRVVAVFGALADKDAAAMVRLLAARVSHWLLVPTAGTRGLSSSALAARLPELANVHQANSVGQAVRLARQLSSPFDLILVWGSFDTVTAVSEQLSGDHAMAQEQRGET